MKSLIAFLIAIILAVAGFVVYKSFVLDKKSITKKSLTHIELLDKNCKSGNMNACGELAFAYHTGANVAPSLSKAIEFYERACLGGDSKSCFNLAMVYEAGDTKSNVEKNISKALTYYKEVCDLGDDNATKSIACYKVGSAYEEGIESQRDEHKAFELYLKSCNLGAANACEKIGNSYLNGVGTIQDLNTSARYFERACEG